MDSQLTLSELLVRLFPFLVCLAFGLVVGSCVNVIAYRVPLRKSIVHPGSFCPQCGFILPWFDNIPVVSWLVLGARCRSCKTLISPRYPLIESTLALLYMGLFAQMYLQNAQAQTVGQQLIIFTSGDYLQLFVGALFIGVMMILALIDIDFRLLPNAITLPSIPVFLLFGLLMCIPPFSEAGKDATLLMRLDPLIIRLIGMIALPLAFVVLDFISVLAFGKAGFGGGDVKLAALIGAALGWKLGVVAIILSILGGGILAILRLATRNIIWGRKTYMAFGPFLCGGAVLSLIFGMEIVNTFITNLGRSGTDAVASLIAGW